MSQSDVLDILLARQDAVINALARTLVDLPFAVLWLWVAVRLGLCEWAGIPRLSGRQIFAIAVAIIVIAPR